MAPVLAARRASARARATLPRQQRRASRPSGSRSPRAAARRSTGRGCAQNGLIVPDGPVTALLEEFRIVKRQVLLAARDALAAGGGGAAQRVLVLLAAAGRGQDLLRHQPRAGDRGREGQRSRCWSMPISPSRSILALLGLDGRQRADGRARRPAGPRRGLRDPRPTCPDCYVLPAGNRTASDSEYPRRAGAPSQVLDRLTQGAPQPRGDLRFPARARPPRPRPSWPATSARRWSSAAPTSTGQRALEDAAVAALGLRRHQAAAQRGALQPERAALRRLLRPG